MNKFTIFRILSILIMVLITLTLASPTYAEGPITNKYVFDTWYTYTGGSCGFDITVHETGTFMDKQWYDENGQLVREMYTYGGNIYYLSANGKTVTVQNSGTTKFNYISPEETLISISGQEWVWSIPGQGMVSGEVGKQDLSYIYNSEGQPETIIHKLVGNIMWTDVVPLLCPYLAP